ncbi:MAG: tetratricopeptide repeat protein [Candidatus Altiarchaeota archaeon]|nr:tetratricopeptide repeat protein [Candidatus Altiarchaeota archaeon]
MRTVNPEVEDVLKLLREAKVAEAMKLADKVEDRREMAVKLTEFAGTLDWMKEKSHAAGVMLIKAIQLHPEYALAHYNLGVALTDIDLAKNSKSNVEAAEREYELTIKFDPDFAPAHYNLALLYYFTGRIAEARGEYAKAVQIDPSRFKSRELGVILENAPASR